MEEASSSSELEEACTLEVGASSLAEVAPGSRQEHRTVGIAALEASLEASLEVAWVALGNRQEHRTVGIVAWEALEVGAVVEEVVDCSTSGSRLDNKLRDILGDRVVVAVPEEEEEEPLQGLEEAS